MMKVLIAAVIIAAVSVTASPSCPPGYIPQGNSCVCGDWPNGMVICYSYEGSLNALMQIGHCMTYDNETGEVRAGGCLNTLFRSEYYKNYYPIPNTVSDLNDQVCGPSNSKGLLCGDCQDGFAVAALWNSFCMNCTGASNGWIKFVAAQYLPLTVIFVLIIIFAVNIVSGPINSFIFFAQIISLTAFNVHGNFNVQDSSTLLAYIDSLKKLPVTVAFTIYDAWNLNVFPRAYIPFFCLTNHLTRFQGMEFQGISSIKLHNWNFRPVVYCWKPFLKPFLRFRRSVDPKTSVINVFATFILLSYGKLLYIVLLFLVPEPLYNGQGQRLSTSVMAFSPSTLFFHKEHLPLAIFSIFVSLTFIAVPPIVLLFYQASLFKKCLTRCKMNSQTLRTFVGTFQGCYKDGTNGTRDFRYFAGLYYILRIIVIICTATYSNLINESVLVCGFIALLFALARPYKKNIYNVIDAVMFGLMGTIFFLITWNVEYTQSHGYPSTPLLVSTKVLYWLPLLYLVLFTVYLVLDRKTSCIQKLRRYKPLHCLFQVQKEEQEASFDDAVPHRLSNPAGYEQL